ncbi:hypothetical protein IAT38_002382 [Cryptococcus sp. DSM 104549]
MADNPYDSYFSSTPGPPWTGESPNNNMASDTTPPNSRILTSTCFLTPPVRSQSHPTTPNADFTKIHNELESLRAIVQVQAWEIVTLKSALAGQTETVNDEAVGKLWGRLLKAIGDEERAALERLAEDMGTRAQRHEEGSDGAIAGDVEPGREHIPERVSVYVSGEYIPPWSRTAGLMAMFTKAPRISTFPFGTNWHFDHEPYPCGPAYDALLQDLLDGDEEEVPPADSITTTDDDNVSVNSTEYFSTESLSSTPRLVPHRSTLLDSSLPPLVPYRFTLLGGHPLPPLGHTSYIPSFPLPPAAVDRREPVELLRHWSTRAALRTLGQTDVSPSSVAACHEVVGSQAARGQLDEESGMEEDAWRHLGDHQGGGTGGKWDTWGVGMGGAFCGNEGTSRSALQ